jgi:hypothetical protein
MEEATEADILAAEATDRYQEIKEISDVAQRGNRLQAGRALSNFQQLDQEARRVLELVREKSRDGGKLQQQIESQERALDTLRDSNRQAEAKPQQAEEGEARGIESWDVNEAFLGRARAEQRKQVDEFKAKQQQFAQGAAQEDQTLEGTIYKRGQYRGKDGGVPPGLREPSDPEPAPPPPGDARATLGVYFNDEGDGSFRTQTASVFDAEKLIEEVNVDNSRFADYTVTRLNHRQAEGGPAQLVDVLDLATAKGRISLRIDLPKDGDVYHFAQLGGAEGVSFGADKKGRGLLHGTLALLSLAAAAACATYRRRAA